MTKTEPETIQSKGDKHRSPIHVETFWLCVSSSLVGRQTTSSLLYIPNCMHKPTAGLRVIATTIYGDIILSKYHAVLSKERPERGRSRGHTEYAYYTTIHVDYKSFYAPYWLARHLYLSCTTSSAREICRVDGTYSHTTSNKTSCNANASYYTTSNRYTYSHSANTYRHCFSRFYA
jgi:hypothetical protein